MIKPNDISFSINEYDHDGDVFEEGIFLHFGECKIHVAASLKGFKDVRRQLKKIEKEIRNNCEI